MKTIYACAVAAMLLVTANVGAGAQSLTPGWPWFSVPPVYDQPAPYNPDAAVKPRYNFGRPSPCPDGYVRDGNYCYPVRNYYRY